MNLRLHIIPLTDAELDANRNPTRPYAITPQEFADLVMRVNWSFDGTGIRLVFNPDTDWQPMADTQLNTDAAGSRERGNQIAASIPGKIVCFLRWGSKATPTGNGNSYPPPGAGPKPPSVDDIVQNYVALPNRIAPNFGLLNQGNGSFVAHEVGHYLGLYHTFPGWDGHDPIFRRYKNPDGTNAPPPSSDAADQAVIDYIVANGGTINALDGDLLSDTPPDPSPVLYAAHGQNICVTRTIRVNGTMNGRSVSFTFTPDPNNVMGYFTACGPGSVPPPARFSAQQSERMVQTLLQHPARRHLVRSFSLRQFLQLKGINPATGLRSHFSARDLAGGLRLLIARETGPFP